MFALHYSNIVQEGAAVFRTIEDFMWFMVSLVQFPAASTSGQLRVGPGKHLFGFTS